MMTDCRESTSSKTGRYFIRKAARAAYKQCLIMRRFFSLAREIQQSDFTVKAPADPPVILQRRTSAILSPSAEPVPFIKFYNDLLVKIAASAGVPPDIISGVQWEKPRICDIEREIPLVSIGPSGIGGEYQNEISE